MSDLRPETLEVPDRVRRQIEEMASRLEAAESALTEALDAMDRHTERCADAQDEVEGELGLVAARIRSQIEGDDERLDPEPRPGIDYKASLIEGSNDEC